MIFIMIEINNLSKMYNNKCMALDGITCSIDKGVFGLLGSNGAGKSTLLKIIATMIEPTIGRVTVNGLDVCYDKVMIRNHLGYLPQEFGFYPRLTGFEMLEYFAVLKGITDKRARKTQVTEAIELVNLTEARNKRIAVYSFGMKQRLGFAQALLGSPRLLIMDEPTVGLDPIERNHIRNVISELGRKITIIYSTHILADIEVCCSELAVLRQGNLVFQGKPEELAKLATGKTGQIKASTSVKDGYLALIKSAR
ncbi:ATP-binding cassette domain-containing protein [Pelorhabdus rhamnosifermentans]|uniref:ATP-binding cassette domain-containing protein n=1 Tax=Pelorhabdus rhamnosifermentans TaxID=2772457 RepID=UPI001C062410|nr:ATP-binding cassette domain-containing protein [Pelorhabdus rhamnosifermentans]